MKPNLQYPLSGIENSFRVFQKTQGACTTPFHYHPIFEMNCVLKGYGSRRIGNNIENFEEGDLTLLAPNIPHHWKNANKKENLYSSLVIQWKEDFLEGSWKSIPEFKDIRRLLKLSSKGIQFNRYLAKEVRERQDELLMLPPFKKLIVFLNILNDFAQTDEFKTLNDADISFGDKVPNSRIQKVCHFIEEKYSEKITLGRVAALVNMSEGAFSRFFSKTTQKPFFSFLNEYRIKRACEMLGETDLPANEIGFACGYDCLQFFYRQFKHYMNCSPLAYRKRAFNS